MKYCIMGDTSVNMSQFQITFHDPLGICRMMVCVYVAFLCLSGQESTAESTRIFRRAASSGAERNRPSDGQQQRSITVGYDRLWDAKADYLKASLSVEKTLLLQHGLFKKKKMKKAKEKKKAL